MAEHSNLSYDELLELRAAVNEEIKILKSREGASLATSLAEQRAENARRVGFLRDNPDVLYFLTHDSFSCSDEYPHHNYESDLKTGLCAKCRLLQLIREEDDEFEIHFRVHLRKSEGELNDEE